MVSLCLQNQRHGKRWVIPLKSYKQQEAKKELRKGQKKKEHATRQATICLVWESDASLLTQCHLRDSTEEKRLAQAWQTTKERDKHIRPNTPHTVIVPMCLTMSVDTPSLYVYSKPCIYSVIRATQTRKGHLDRVGLPLQNTSYIMQPASNIHALQAGEWQAKAEHSQPPHDFPRPLLSILLWSVSCQVEFNWKKIHIKILCDRLYKTDIDIIFWTQHKWNLRGRKSESVDSD